MDAYTKKDTTKHLMEQYQHNQKTFQRQPQVNLCGKEELLKKPRLSLKMQELRQIRFWRDIGRGFKTPKEALYGVYIDKNCPWTGDIRIRGRLFKGVVKSAKMKRTCVVRKDYLHYIKKYRRYERRHKNISVHVSPCFRVKPGDTVIFGECRPIAKTVRHNALQVIPKVIKRKIFKD